MSVAVRETVLTLPFLGERTYLQGTTLLDALLGLLPAGTDLSVRLPHLLTTDTVRVSHGAAAGDPVPAHAVLTHSGGRGRLEVRPLDPSATITRIPYDEAPVWDAAHFTPGVARLDTPSPHSFVATSVSLLKALMLRDAPPAAPGQWLFTGLDLLRHPGDAFLPLTVRRQSFVAGRMARAGLQVGDAPVGRLYFAWVARGASP